MATLKSDAKILEILTSLSKQRGFVFQSSEIYGGLGSTWDYGPLGVELKRNIKNLWWQNIVTSRENVVGMDASILMHPKVWEASGHVENFHDPLVDNKISKKRYRLDHLLEEQTDKVFESLLNKLKIKNKSVIVRTEGDHRICMASTILALATGAKITIKNFETVNTSFPNFISLIKSIGGKIEIQKK